MRNPIRIASLLLLVNTSALLAQSNVSSGEIKGLVQDSSGAIVPGVQITVSSAGTGFKRTGETDDRGEYRVMMLPPGTYDVSAELTGFATQIRNNVSITVGQTVVMDFRIQVGVAVQTVTVTGELPLIETARAQQANTISETFIRSLPIDRRDYLTFTLLAPGVVDSNALADNSDFRVTQTPQSGLSFYGSNGRGNSVTVDGAEANDASGGVRSTLSQEAVQEFQINRSNYSAELGGANGGVINIVSKSGGNDVRGKVFGFFRSQKLDAADPFAIALEGGVARRIKPDAQRQQYGATLSFPIRKDRTFFFGSFEGLHRDEFSTVAVLTDRNIFNPTAAQTAIIDRMAQDTSTTPATCIPTLVTAASLPPAICASAIRRALTSRKSTEDLFQQNSGVFPFTTNSRALSFRLDHRATAYHQMFLRYSFTNNDEGNQSSRALVGFSRSNNLNVLDSNAAIGWTSVAGPRLVNEARFQWNYRNYFVNPNDRIGPEINITGYGFFNRDIFLPSFTTERRYEAADSLSYSSRNHLFKLGVALLWRGNRSDSYTFMGGRFGFGSLPGSFLSPALATTTLTALQAFDLGLPQSYQQGFGEPTVAATLPYYAFYVQDSWNPFSNLTLNYGLRYELDDRQDPVPTDRNNFAPRFGFAWDPWNNAKTVLRGGFGIYYSPIYYQIDHVVNSLNEIDGYRQIAQVLTTLNPVNPLATSGPINVYQKLLTQGIIGIPRPTRSITAADLTPFGITVSQTGTRPPFTVLFRIDPNYRSPYSQQASLGIEHELLPGFSTSINYIFASTLKITRSRDLNILSRPAGSRGIPEWTAASGCTGAGLASCFRDPQLFQENIYESSARAFYHGMILEASKSFSRGFSIAGNYTFSKAIDEVTDFNSDFQPNDQTNLRYERALSAFDQRHKLVLYANLQSPIADGAGISPWRRVVADFVLTPIFRANSARPFNLLTGAELNGDRHSSTDRPVMAGRNTGIGPDFWTMDLRLARTIKFRSETRSLELIFEGFNLFNRLNFASVNNTVGTSFSPPYRVSARKDLGPSSPLGFTSAFDARRIQLGFRLAF